MDDWVEGVSRRTGKKYWFNVRSGESVWTCPPFLSNTVLRKADALLALVAATTSGAGSPSIASPSPAATGGGRAGAGASSSSSSSSSASFGSGGSGGSGGGALSSMLARLSGSAAVADDSGFSFPTSSAPPSESSLREAFAQDVRQRTREACRRIMEPGSSVTFVRFEPMEEFGLFQLEDEAQEASVPVQRFGEGSETYCVLFRPGTKPPEQEEADAEELRLTEESKRLRERDRAAAAAGAAELNALVRQAKATAPPPRPEDTLVIEPIRILDKRSIAEIMAEQRSARSFHFG